MIEVEVDVRGPFHPFGAHAIGIAPQHEPGQQLDAVVAVPDLLGRWTLLRKLRDLALIGEADVQIELVEGHGDHQHAANPEILDDAVDELKRPEGRAAGYVRAGPP